MTKHKDFTIKAPWFDDAAVTVRVDLEKLTPELAKEINDFWGGGRERLQEEDGDVIRVVLRLFGSDAIRYFMEKGGESWNFSAPEQEAKAVSETACFIRWTEGYPAADEKVLLIVRVDVDIPSFDDVEVCDAE